MTEDASVLLLYDVRRSTAYVVALLSICYNCFGTLRLVSRLQALTTLVEKRDIDGMLPIGSAVNFICLSNGILHHLVQW